MGQDNKVMGLRALMGREAKEREIYEALGSDGRERQGEKGQ